MNQLTKEQKNRFNSQKRNWEIYGSLGMGIAYHELEQFIADELALEKEQAKKEERIRVTEFLLDIDLEVPGVREKILDDISKLSLEESK
jgi:hypothetical protein